MLKIVLYLGLGVLGLVSSEIDNDRYIIFQDENNMTRVIDLHEKPQQALLELGRSTSLQSHEYLLFTRTNWDIEQALLKFDKESISNSNFNPEHQTVVIIHGWKGSRESGCNIKIRDAYLNKMDANVIVVDWSTIAAAGYTTAVAGVPGVGRELSELLQVIVELTGAQFTNMHIIGFSLGAHIAASAGRLLKGKVARITGLDPAGPLWQFNANRLMKSDAIYVEGIHTNQRLLGIKETVGHLDFFPNGGLTQPGCALDDCSHKRAWELFAASVDSNHFVGYKCSNVFKLEFNICNGNTRYMGNTDLKKNGNGMYYVRVKDEYPY